MATWDSVDVSTHFIHDLCVHLIEFLSLRELISELEEYCIPNVSELNWQVKSFEYFLKDHKCWYSHCCMQVHKNIPTFKNSLTEDRDPSSTNWLPVMSQNTTIIKIPTWEQDKGSSDSIFMSCIIQTVNSWPFSSSHFDKTGMLPLYTVGSNGWPLVQEANRWLLCLLNIDAQQEGWYSALRYRTTSKHVCAWFIHGLDAGSTPTQEHKYFLGVCQLN